MIWEKRRKSLVARTHESRRACEEAVPSDVDGIDTPAARLRRERQASSWRASGGFTAVSGSRAVDLLRVGVSSSPTGTISRACVEWSWRAKELRRVSKMFAAHIEP